MSMIEVMLALVVVAVAVLGTFAAMGTSHQVSKTATARSRVLEQVQRTVEEIQNTSFGSYSAQTFVVDGVQPVDGRDTVGVIDKFQEIAGRKIRFRIEAKWKDDHGESTLSTVYVHCNRGY